MLILVEDLRSRRPFALAVLILYLPYFLHQTGVLMALQDRTITGFAPHLLLNKRRERRPHRSSRLGPVCVRVRGTDLSECVTFAVSWHRVGA